MDSKNFCCTHTHTHTHTHTFIVLSDSRSNIAAIVGGVIGGLIVLGLKFQSISFLFGIAMATILRKQLQNLGIRLFVNVRIIPLL